MTHYSWLSRHAQLSISLVLSGLSKILPRLSNTILLIAIAIVVTLWRNNTLLYCISTTHDYVAVQIKKNCPYYSHRTQLSLEPIQAC